jgi:murein DD-endopeptidase MepM/ murein hydrolase activator NlpD
MKNANDKISAIAAVFAIALSGVAAEETPVRYLLSYPAAEQFCPPVEGFFDEVERTIDRVRGRTFRHQPNGGYGLPVVDKVGDAHLLHLGADVGWYRVGDPVFAVANGVVRVSQGDIEQVQAISGFGKDRGAADGSTKNKTPSPGSRREQPSPGSADRAGRRGRGLVWGNVVVIEHRFADGKYATTIYGHLANERLVKAGDVVHVGQQIGVIGTTKVNGGYKPHLHLGVRDGRMAEAGRKIVLMTSEGKLAALDIAEVKEQEEMIVLKGGGALPAFFQIGNEGPRFDLTRRGEDLEAPAALLSYLPSPEFAIVGYGLSTDGWRDPIAFLKTHGADTNPAPFEPARKQRAGGRR